VEKNSPLFFLQAGLAALTHWLTAENVPYALVGGLAASLLGRPRMTRDIDILASIDEDSWAHFIESGAAYGIVPRISDSLDFARQSRVFLLQHQESSIEVDIICAGLPYEHEIIAQAAPRDVAGHLVPVSRAEDLIIMKAVAQRPRDLGDIEGITDTQASIDWEYVIHMAREFAEALDASAILRTVELLRTRHEARNEHS
jgi:hypothetical protein